MKDYRKLTEFTPRIEEVSLDKIRPNELNPRRRFEEEAEDQLLVSMEAKGILNPLIVFERSGIYYLLDGERRFRCAKKLNLKTVPVHVLVHPPSELENLSLMFHIHNVRDEWTDVSTIQSLRKVSDLLGTKNVKELSKATALPEYRVRKYLHILSFPESILKDFRSKDEDENQIEPDVDFLAEIYSPISKIKNTMPSLLERFPVDQIVKICLEKKNTGTIKNNKDLRDISKIIVDAKIGKIDLKVAEEKIESFLADPETTVEKIYLDTSAPIHQAKRIVKNSEALIEEIKEIDVRRLPNSEKERLMKALENLKKILDMRVER